MVDAVPVRLWLEQLRLLVDESTAMDAVDVETAYLLAEMNPDFIPRLVETLFLISQSQSPKDFQFISMRLAEQKRAFEEIIVQTRQRNIGSRPIAFKQRFAHTLIVCKRLVYRLGTLTQARSHFPASFDRSST